MRPVDTFLRSVREAFRPAHDDSSGWTWVGLAACAVLIATAILFRRYRRQQRERQEFATFLEGRHVSVPQVQLIHRLAAGVSSDPKDVAAHIDAFERATAGELATHKVSPTSGEEGIFAQIAELRRTLGFASIGQHFALLTTRELESGQIVAVSGTEATVTEVNEAFFAVTAPAGVSFPVGAVGTRARVTLVHAQEARYETRCALVERAVGAGSQRLVFRHDEEPTRIQLRKAVRVTVRGPVRLDQVGGASADRGRNESAEGSPRGAIAAATATAGVVDTASTGTQLGSADFAGGRDNASLLDISVGGAALDATVHIAVGALVHLSFELDGAPYHDLLALVLECSRRGRDNYHMRVEFRSLAQADEQRLAASVARYSAKPFTQQP